MGNFYVIPGIESWTAYSSKVGAQPTIDPRDKLEKVIEHFYVIRPYVAGIQANFLFGLDIDTGDEPMELTKEFTSRVPYAMPNINIPIPFGKTPLYEKYLSENRLLVSMPFTFYYLPYLVYMLKNYDPVTFYEKLIDIFSYISSRNMLLKRLQKTSALFPTAYNFFKGLGNRQMVGRLRYILNLLTTDKQFRAFHEHQTDVLPEYYHHEYERFLGPYATLMPYEDRKPILASQRESDVHLKPKDKSNITAGI
jgi:hypothetical protein